MPRSFSDRYGPWAVVAGASEGLGEAFARSVARRGLNVVLIARREAPLEKLAASLQAETGVSVRALPLDLARVDLADELRRHTADLEIGLAIHNAAFAPVGPFLERSLADHLTAVDVNIRAPLVLAHTLAPAMIARGAGGLLLMSSLAGVRGTPRLASYSGTKAFARAFGEALWHELREGGVDTLVCSAGAIRTPGYDAHATQEAPGTLGPDEVSERALAALGRGPNLVPGAVNRVAELILGRLLPSRWGVAAMSRNTRDLS